jgi:predicted amidohydrolase
MKRMISIAMVQMTSEYGNVAANVGKALKVIDKIGEMEADIICLPEMFNTGYDLKVMGRQISSLAEDEEGYTVKCLSERAKRYGMYVIAPLIWKNTGGKPYDAAVFIGDDGNIKGVYKKNHLFGDEARYFEPGDGYRVFDTRFGKVGTVICYDANFVEPFRITALMGAEIIFVPAAWRIQEKFIWERLPSMRAIDNGVYTVFINAYNKTEDLHLFGYSMLSDPFGNIEAACAVDAEDFAVKSVDLGKIEEYRQQVRIYENRRPETYGLISNILGERK